MSVDAARAALLAAAEDACMSGRITIGAFLERAALLRAADA